MYHKNDIGIVNNDMFETGRPVEFNYLHNTVPSPDMGERFQQHIEPAGRYMIYDTLSDGKHHPSWEAGIAKFDNPLVITFHSKPGGFTYDDMSWKMRLHKAYDGLTGKRLSKAILEDGYDGIVTIRTNDNGEPTEVSEIVDLRPFKKANKEWRFRYAQQWKHKWQDIEWPVRQGVGDDINEMDSPPETEGGDYVLYHGTSLPIAQKIVNERRLTADDWGCVGVCTTHRAASVYGSMKAHRLPDGSRVQSAVLRLVVDGDWLRQQELTREGGGSGHDLWLVQGNPGPAEIPPEALKDIRIWTVSGERVAEIRKTADIQNWTWDEQMQNEWMSALDIIDDDIEEPSWRYDFVTTAAYRRGPRKPYTGPPRYFGPARLIRFMGRPTIVGNTMSIRRDLPNLGFRWDGNIQIDATQLGDAQDNVINGAMIGTRELTPEEISTLSRMGVDMSMQSVEFQPWTRQPATPVSDPVNPSPEQSIQPDQPPTQAPIQKGAQDNQANIEMIMKLRDAATNAEKGEVVTEQVQKLIGLLTNPNLTEQQAKLKEQFLKFMSTAHNYSFFNTILIFMQNSSATMVGGAKNFWETKGRSLAEGAQPIWILAPIIRQKQVSRAEYASMADSLRKDGVPESEIKDRIKKILSRSGQLVGFKDVPVYDVSQTQEIPGWTDEKGNPPFNVDEFHMSYRNKMNTPDEYADALFFATVKAAEKMSIKVSTDATGHAGGYSSGGNIVLDNSSMGERRVATMFHEFAHEVLHQGEENRRKRREEKTQIRHVELEAEAAAFLLAQAFDIKGDPEWAARYIFLWDNKPEDVMERQQNIHRAYKSIFDAVKIQLDEIISASQKQSRQAWSYNYIKTSWRYQFKTANATVTLDQASLKVYSEKVREYWMDLASWSMTKDNDPSKFTFEMAEEETQRTVEQTVINMMDVQQNIQTILNTIPWNDSPVFIKVGSPGFVFMNKPEWGSPVSNAEIVIGQGQMAPSFSYFYDNESNQLEIDDILDAGDDDFFNDPKQQSDYFNLVRYLKNPNSLQSSKVVTVYTARPSIDRQIYLNFSGVPSNIFVTNNYNHAEGLSRDLPGGARDIWKIRIEEKYLMPTLDMGHLKEYQVIGDGMVPVRSMVLLDVGDAT